jgi:ribosome-binding protein aMBF1 (putative translation factor)
MNTGKNWKDYRATLNLTDEDEAEISLEEELIYAIAKAREEQGMSQKQLAQACGVPQPVIARLEKATHSPQVNTILRVLKPLGYTLAVVPEKRVP